MQVIGSDAARVGEGRRRNKAVSSARQSARWCGTRPTISRSTCRPSALVLFGAHWRSEARKQPARLHDEDAEQVSRIDQTLDEVWLFLPDEGMETAHLPAQGTHATVTGVDTDFSSDIAPAHDTVAVRRTDEGASFVQKTAPFLSESPFVRFYGVERSWRRCSRRRCRRV